MEKAFKRIGLIARQRAPGAVDTLITLRNYLLNRQLSLVVEEESSKCIDTTNVEIVPRAEVGKSCDLVIVVGGDGSLLNAAHVVVDDNVPVLGINRGRMGFLTDIHPSELQTEVGKILDGQYEEEQRFLLHADIIRDNQIHNSGTALNEVVLYAGDVARMIEFEVYIDGHFVYSQRSDGLIVATPTGSTAYALSGGGPIIHPGLDAVVLVPMFPHTLTSRPIVIDSNVTIELVVAPAREIYPGVSCDGQAPILLSPGDRIKLTKKENLLRLIHPLNHNFFQVLRAKLQWGTKWQSGF